MKIRTLLASVAVATLVLTQPLAAATRSADSLPQRVSAPVANANYQNDDDDDGGSTAVILGVVLVILVGIATISGGGNKSPG